MITRLEALADALTRVTGWSDPESDAYQNRNPGDLPAVSPKHPRDRRGKRIFSSALDGYQALLFDLEVKCSGRSTSKLTPDSTLRDLVRIFGQSEVAAKKVASFVKRAIKDETVTDRTPLSFFLES